MWFTFRTVIILGDFNVSHKPIDHCNPDADDVSTIVKAVI